MAGGTEGWAGSRWLKPLVAGLAAYQLIYLAIYLAKPHPAAEPPFSDFYAFWSFGRFLQTLPAHQIYDFAMLQPFQHDLRPGFDAFYPCVYPPILLPFLQALGALGYLPAFAVWTTLGLAGFVLAVAGRDWRAPTPWLAILAPTTILAVVSGQNGLLTAALLIGGFRLMARRPWLAGVLLGLLAFKPQLFALLPIVLLAGRRWRTLAAVGLTVAGMVGLSLSLYGLGAWRAWVEALPTFSQALESQREAVGWLMPTITAGLRGAGLTGPLVGVVQGASAAMAVIALVLLFHHGRERDAPSALDAAAVQVGTFLATPYAFVYDMPMVSAAVVALVAARLSSDQSWRPGERVVAVAAYGLPLALLSGGFKTVPIGPIALTALFAVLVRAAWHLRSKSAP